MNWQKLLSTKSFSLNKENDFVSDTSLSNYKRLNPFINDHNKIIFSSAFRRLQDKTQVHTLVENDFVRTRLTHSIEVASVGRLLGINAGRVIIERNYHNLRKRVSPEDFGHILSASCLAHDIGNPPFGHFGETIIRKWFKNNSSKLNNLTGEQKSDFEIFEGNAQGFRILNKIGGISSATMGTFTKYPKTSSHQNTYKKFGIMQSEKEIFEKVADELGLIKNAVKNTWCRHPLTYLMESADDICYLVVDLEDAFKLEQLKFSQTEGLMLQILGGYPQHYSDISDDSERISFLRSKCIEQLINEISDIFKDSEPTILAGKFSGCLLDKSIKSNVFKEIKSFSEREIYYDPKDSFGFNNEDLLLELLDEFYSPEKSDYEGFLELTDFISGMTDSYALREFKKLDKQENSVYNI